MNDKINTITVQEHFLEDILKINKNVVKHAIISLFGDRSKDIILFKNNYKLIQTNNGYYQIKQQDNVPKYNLCLVQEQGLPIQTKSFFSQKKAIFEFEKLCSEYINIDINFKVNLVK